MPSGRSTTRSGPTKRLTTRRQRRSIPALPGPIRASCRRYPGHFEVRLVSRNGGVRWHKGWVNVSHVLAEEYVGFEEVDDGGWDLYFGPMKLGRFHERLRRVEDPRGNLARKNLKV